VLPANERLEGDRPPACERDDRLEVHADLAAADSVLERACKLVTSPDTHVHLRLEGRIPALAGGLCAVHRNIRVREKFVGGARTARGGGDADACVNGHLASVQEERHLHRFDHSHRDVLRHLFAARVEEDPELVASETRCEIAGPDTCAHALGDGDEELVAGAVPECVVDRLEVVEIDEQDGRRVRMRVQRSGNALCEERAVGEPGQRVMERAVPQLFLHLIVLEENTGMARECLEQPAIII
jgi:hypothetical protein